MPMIVKFFVRDCLIKLPVQQGTLVWFLGKLIRYLTIVYHEIEVHNAEFAMSLNNPLFLLYHKDHTWMAINDRAVPKEKKHFFHLFQATTLLIGHELIFYNREPSRACACSDSEPVYIIIAIIRFPYSNSCILYHKLVFLSGCLSSRGAHVTMVAHLLIR